MHYHHREDRPSIFPLRKPTRRSATLAGIVLMIFVATIAATVALWPAKQDVPRQESGSVASGEVVDARVTHVEAVACVQPQLQGGGQASGQAGGQAGQEAQAGEQSVDQQSIADAPTATDCLSVRAHLPVGKPVAFFMDAERAKSRPVAVGDAVRLIAHEYSVGDETVTNYSFYDYPRGGKMLAVAILFVLVVVLVGRVRGGLALIGVGAAVALLVMFILPAILAGHSPVLVAIVGSLDIMIIVLYLAHGFSHRTTAALFGSIFGIVFTAVAGAMVTRWLRFTGISTTEESSLSISVPGIQMNDILTATIVIAGLGVLNDITVSQASVVWEMRALNPHLSRRRIYASAMRVGRDHIASSIYTLVFAYAGSMLVVLLLIYAFPKDLIELVTSEQLGQEVIRTLVGATGLVLSMPVTTLCAIWFTKPGADHASSAPPPAHAQH